ncbi:MFS transporter [Microbacterium sp.]|uniref:MFS transporter n=1 Tax=Microbacterium sp. TaxID=51671 RepID=UPI0028121844|nr:MFS transporter [Microbacterium sp.]
MKTGTERFLPIGVYVLAFSLFAMGSAEFLLAGILPAVAQDIDVDLAAAGGLITAFAVGVVIGGPPFAVLSLRWPRRAALIVTQLAFAASIAAGIVAGTYPALLVSRFVAGLAYAGFFAVAAVTAVGLVASDRAARASGVVVSGLSLAMILGGPAGTFLGYQIGWASGFWLVVTLTVMGAATTAFVLPRTTAATEPSIRRELDAMRQPRLWLILLVTMLSTAAYMISFSYLSELLRSISRVPDAWIAAVLVLFGVGAWAGLTIGGRISDRRPHLALVTGAVGIAASSVLIAVFAAHPLIVVPLVLVLGVFGFVLNPALYGRVFRIAGDAPTLAGATTVSAFQLGIGIIPVLAAVVLEQGLPITAAVWIGAGIAVLTIPLIVIDARLGSGGREDGERQSVSARVLPGRPSGDSAYRQDRRGSHR